MDQIDNDNPANFLLKVGTRLAQRYLIQGTISHNSISAVYQGRDLRFPNVVKPVIVKEFYNPSQDPQSRQDNLNNFEHRVNLLAAVSHPAIPAILDYFIHDRHAYLVLEYVHGRTLASLVQERAEPLSPDQVIPWAIALCEVLQVLHEHEPEPIYIYDLNPGNIMLDQHNQVLLVDFGLAASFHADALSTMRGSEEYIAPELAHSPISAAADIYSLGACLFHLLSGETPPAPGSSPADQKSLQQTNPLVSAGLEQVITNAMQVDIGSRYQNAGDLKSELLVEIGRSASRQLAPQFNVVAPIPEGDIKPLWKFTSGDEIRGSPSYHRGIVYFGSYDHNLYAVNVVTGKMVWKYQTDGGIVSRPALFEDSIFVGSEDERLHVVSARSGSLLWAYYTKGPIRSSPFVAHGHVFIGSDDMSLHAVNIKAGRGIWQIDTIGEIRSTPYVTQEEVYAGNEAGEFYCIDFRGGIKWRFKAKRAITSSAVIADNQVFFCSLDSHIYALDAKSGYLNWRFKMDKGSISSPWLAGNLLYTGSIDGNIYCINRNKAKEVWRFKTENQVTGSPIVMDDNLYCGSVDGFFYCLDAHTGQLRWKFNTQKPITGTPCAGKDQVYIGSTDHVLYALPAKPSG